MIKGWRNDIQWVMYYEKKREEQKQKQFELHMLEHRRMLDQAKFDADIARIQKEK